MLPVIQKRFNEIELIRLKLLEDLDQLTSKQLLTRPGPNKWCLTEVLQHIIIAEREVLLQSPANLPKLLKKPGMLSPLMFGIVLLVLEFDLPVPVPSVEMIPHGHKKLPELIRQWEYLRTCLGSFLHHVTPATMNIPIFFHPLAGMLDVRQTLRLARLHLLHHCRQVNEIIIIIKTK